MKSTSLIIFANIANAQGVQPSRPASDGKFFYLELDKNLDSRSIQINEYAYMYHANVYAGSE